MKRFIPEAKLSKKAKREISKKQRQTWMINPISRKSANKKAYDRKVSRLFTNNYPDSGAFLCA